MFVFLAKISHICVFVFEHVVFTAVHPSHSSAPSLHFVLCAFVCVHVLRVGLNQNVRVQETRAGFSGSVSIPSITKNRAEPGRSMSASSGLGIRE